MARLALERNVLSCDLIFTLSKRPASRCALHWREETEFCDDISDCWAGALPGQDLASFIRWAIAQSKMPLVEH